MKTETELGQYLYCHCDNLTEGAPQPDDAAASGTSSDVLQVGEIGAFFGARPVAPASHAHERSYPPRSAPRSAPRSLPLSLDHGVALARLRAYRLGRVRDELTARWCCSTITTAPTSRRGWARSTRSDRHGRCSTIRPAPASTSSPRCSREINISRPRGVEPAFLWMFIRSSSVSFCSSKHRLLKGESNEQPPETSHLDHLGQGDAVPAPRVGPGLHDREAALRQ